MSLLHPYYKSFMTSVPVHMGLIDEFTISMVVVVVVVVAVVDIHPLFSGPAAPYLSCPNCLAWGGAFKSGVGPQS